MGKIDPLGLDVITEIDEKNREIILHNLVMYHAAPGENIDIAKYAAEHKKLMEDWFAKQFNGGKISWQGQTYQISLNMVIRTPDQIPSIPAVSRPDPGLIRARGLDYYSAELRKFREADARRWIYEDPAGLFQQVKLTRRRSGRYDKGTVPVSDPGWLQATHTEILAHELVGHGLSNVDEYDLSKRLAWEQWFKQYSPKHQGPERDSFMYMEDARLRGKHRMYPRHLLPALVHRSNHPYKGSGRAPTGLMREYEANVHRLDDPRLPGRFRGVRGVVIEEMNRIIGRSQ